MRPPNCLRGHIKPQCLNASNDLIWAGRGGDLLSTHLIEHLLYDLAALLAPLAAPVLHQKIGNTNLQAAVRVLH